MPHLPIRHYFFLFTKVKSNTTQDEKNKAKKKGKWLYHRTAKHHTKILDSLIAPDDCGEFVSLH